MWCPANSGPDEQTATQTGMKKQSSSIAELVGKLKEASPKAWQYLEVKQMAEILDRHRAQLRQVVRQYRILKQTLTAETDPIEKLYLGYEGMFLRDHLRDALRLYVMVNHDFHDARRSYLAGLEKTIRRDVPIPKELLRPAAAKSRRDVA